MNTSTVSFNVSNPLCVKWLKNIFVFTCNFSYTNGMKERKRNLKSNWLLLCLDFKIMHLQVNVFTISQVIPWSLCEWSFHYKNNLYICLFHVCYTFLTDIIRYFVPAYVLLSCNFFHCSCIDYRHLITDIWFPLMLFIGSVCIS